MLYKPLLSANRPHEVRAVERQALLKTLNQALPGDTIMFNSRVKTIRKPRDVQSPIEVELENGDIIKTKVGHTEFLQHMKRSRVMSVL